MRYVRSPKYTDAESHSSPNPDQHAEKVSGGKQLDEMGRELLIKATQETFIVDPSVDMLTSSLKVTREEEDKRKAI